MRGDSTRREVIGGGLLALGGLLLGGCTAAGDRSAWLPEPAWPGADRRPPADPPARRDGSGLGGGSSLAILPRSAWTGSAPIVALADRMGSVRRITIHHDAMDAVGIASPAQAADRLSGIRRYHTQLGWADIGYHYSIDPSGRIWSARPLALQGAHVRDQNERNLGVMLMGNFMHERPTPAAIASLRAFVAMQARRFGVPPHLVRTHRELAPTECPGTHLQAEVDLGRRERAPGFA